ncbi:MAG: trypsin-like peptidase domain-containing protein [Chloroflexi bacterium]|nr:trypsin-like peptidase domain-containing protein [Chloroflexota bacterium]
MFIVRKEPPTFPDVAAEVLRSIVAVAVGTTEKNEPNIVGTGFACEASEFYVTCWHVAEVQDKFKALSSEELKSHGLVDAKLRFGFRKEDGTYVWPNVEDQPLFRAAEKAHDVCVYRLLGFTIPHIVLPSQDKWVLGKDIGIAGFPMGNALQGSTVRPFVSRTVLAGGLELQTQDGEVPRVAIATAVAGGFSGAPIFSAVDGEVLGMVASKVMEGEEATAWPAGISLGIVPSIIKKIFLELNRESTDAIRASLKATPPA